jgi:hypothetical protein
MAAAAIQSGHTSKTVSAGLRRISVSAIAKPAAIGKNGGNTDANDPPAVATPRPPRNPVHTGHTCPAIAAVPAAYAAGSLIGSPANPAAVPFRMSSRITSAPHPEPSTRIVFSPPGLPLPARRMSTEPRETARVTTSAEGNVPIR